MTEHKPATNDDVSECPDCKVLLEFGYGLAGGGMGPYEYCPQCGAVYNKTQDHDGDEE